MQQLSRSQDERYKLPRGVDAVDASYMIPSDGQLASADSKWEGEVETTERPGFVLIPKLLLHLGVVVEIWLV